MDYVFLYLAILFVFLLGRFINLNCTHKPIDVFMYFSDNCLYEFNTIK